MNLVNGDNNSDVVAIAAFRGVIGDLYQNIYKIMFSQEVMATKDKFLTETLEPFLKNLNSKLDKK